MTEENPAARAEASHEGRALSPSLAARADVCRHLWYLECHGDSSLKERIDRSVDIYAFLLHQLGVTVSPSR